ncbi:armadillo-type protein [Mycena galopus ATCC 62051]|nr:armadillo-type protein [Mycena galopus ATCC 62051]
MHPLVRSHTPQSTYSWWSDRNPAGPTISIHAAAKPLVRFMYHEQVRSFIKKNRGVALSRDTMEICFSYLTYKYISPTTKSLILKELDTRVQIQEEARTIQTFVLEQELAVQLLDSRDARIRHYTCNIFGSLAATYDSGTWGSEICARIVSLLRDADTMVQASAVRCTARISETSDGVQAIGTTIIWEYLSEHPESDDLQTRQFLSKLLRNLADYDFMTLRIVESDIKVRQHAIYRLSMMSSWHKGAQAVIQAGAMDALPSLDYPDPEMQRWTCDMISNLAFSHESISHGPISAARLPIGVDICLKLVSFLSTNHKYVRESALMALSNISRSPERTDYANGVKVAQAIEGVPALLDSCNTDVQKWTCEILGNLALHTSTSIVAATFDVELCKLIVSLLSHEDRDVRGCALYAVAMISHSHDGAKSVKRTDIWDCFPHLLNSSYPQTQRFTCQIAGNLAVRRSCCLLDAASYVRIVALLRDDDTKVKRYPYTRSQS